jgi:cell division protein FtsL
MGKTALRRILRASEKASKKYERIDEKYKYDIDYRTAEQLQVCCRTLEKIEDIAREELDMREKEEDA